MSSTSTNISFSKHVTFHFTDLWSNSVTVVMVLKKALQNVITNINIKKVWRPSPLPSKSATLMIQN